MRPDGCIDRLSNWFVREMEGGILEGMQPTPAVFQLIADTTCPTVEKKKKTGLNLFPWQRSTAATPRLENLPTWERLRKNTQGLMTREIRKYETTKAIYVCFVGSWL